MSRSLLDWLFRTGEVEGRVYKCNMRKCLWEIANLALRMGVVFFGQKPDIIPERKQPLEQLLCFDAPPGRQQAIYEPEAAGEEDAFTWG